MKLVTIAILIFSITSFSSEVNPQKIERMKEVLTLSKKSLKNLSHFKFVSEINKLEKALNENGEFELADSISGLKDQKNRALLVERIEMIQEADDELGVLLIVDLIILLSGNTTLAERACWSAYWTRSVHCVLYALAAILTLDGEEVEFE